MFLYFTCLLLTTIVLLIAVSIYCYLIKYKAKQKHLLPFYITNNKLKEVLYILKNNNNNILKKWRVKMN